MGFDLELRQVPVERRHLHTLAVFFLCGPSVPPWQTGPRWHSGRIPMFGSFGNCHVATPTSVRLQPNSVASNLTTKASTLVAMASNILVTSNCLHFFGLQ